MLAEERFKQLKDLLGGSTREELIWINGYLSGLVSNGHSNGNSQALSANGQATLTSTKKITLAYGTETGNSKRLATQLAAVARKHSLLPKLVGLDQYRFTDLEKEEYFFIVISTQGEGEPPITAKRFYDHIHQNKLTLPNLKYSVLALGDSSYPLFCKTGEDVDSKLHEFGAKRLVPVQKCDVDYEEDASKWFDDIVQKLNEQVEKHTPASVEVPEKKTSSKKHYNGTIITNINLNDRGSNKQTFHIELGTEEPVQYEAGDALAIIPVNKKIIVDHIFLMTGADKSTYIETAKSKGSAEELLTSHLNICYLLGSVIRKYATLTGQEIPDVRMDLIDLLRIYPLKNKEQFPDLIKLLTPIAPRLYSISSSPSAHGLQEIHLTVSRHSFRVKEEQRFGLCSDFLGELPVGTQVNFYIHKNRSFRLPAADKDIIMIGPGTGIAPFRSFLSERNATGANGKNWFFFGEQHFVTDFLYQSEMQDFFSTGLLSRISLAFSRDQEQKIYVQHRMLEQAAEFYRWIEKGAYLYVSGTKDPMSRDVEQTLIKILGEQGNKTPEEAKKYLHQLKEAGRYEKDVY